MIKIKFNEGTKVFSMELDPEEIYTDKELQELATEGDTDLTGDTKEFIGNIEPNRPFHRTSFRHL